MNLLALLFVSAVCHLALSSESHSQQTPPSPDAPREKVMAFVHPGLLHSEEDFTRMRANLEREPWKSGWAKLVANRHASLAYKAHPVAVVVRGRDRLHTVNENYAALFNDVAAAYVCALRWKISGERAYAEKAIEILNAWSGQLKQISGSNDLNLAAGIYGYQIANAGEIMRSYEGWRPGDFARFQKMMKEVFTPSIAASWRSITRRRAITIGRIGTSAT